LKDSGWCDIIADRSMDETVYMKTAMAAIILREVEEGKGKVVFRDTDIISAVLVKYKIILHSHPSGVDFANIFNTRPAKLLAEQLIGIILA
jgi:hypothetical protein